MLLKINNNNMKNMDKVLKSIVESCKLFGIILDKPHWKVEKRPAGKMAEFYFTYKGSLYGGGAYYKDISDALKREEIVLRIVSSMRTISK